MSDRGGAIKPLVHALQAVFGTMLILGCASSGDLKPEIKPVFMMQHGGNQADGYYQLGRYYQSNGRSKNAEAAYRKALALDDRLAEAHSALGAMYALNRSFALAMVELNAAVALDPAAPHFRNNLGYAYYLQGKAAEAIANFEIAAVLDPANPRTWNNLGLAQAQLGKTDRAEEAYARATALASAGALPARTVSSAPAQQPVKGLAASAANGPEAGSGTAAAETTAMEPTRVVETTVLAPIPVDDRATLAPWRRCRGGRPRKRTTRTPLRRRLCDPNRLPLSSRCSPWSRRRFRSCAGSNLPSCRRLRTSRRHWPIRLPHRPRYRCASRSPPCDDAGSGRGARTRGRAAAAYSWQMLAAADLVLVPSLRVESDPPLTMITPIARLAESADAPARERSSGTLVYEIPVVAQVVTIAPYVVELKWSGSAVIVRPVAQGDLLEPDTHGLEVSNGNGVAGMARRIDGLLQGVGLPKSRLTNQKPFTQRFTEIHYRGGYEAAAGALSARFPSRPALVRDNRLRADIDVRLVLGKDLPTAVALVEPARERDRWAGTASNFGASDR